MNSTEEDDDESLDTRRAIEEAEIENEKWRQKRREENTIMQPVIYNLNSKK